MPLIVFTQQGHHFQEPFFLLSYKIVLQQIVRDQPDGIDRPLRMGSMAPDTGGIDPYALIRRSDRDPLLSLIHIYGLQAITTSAHDSGFAAVHLETDEKTDPRAQVFRLLAGADCPIMELKSASMSLEDVFLELTSQDMQAEGGTNHDSDL